MLEESPQADIDGGNDVLVRNLCEYIESETYPRYGGAFQVLRAVQTRVASYSTTRTLTFRNVFTNMS